MGVASDTITQQPAFTAVPSVVETSAVMYALPGLLAVTYPFSTEATVVSLDAHFIAVVASAGVMVAVRRACLYCSNFNESLSSVIEVAGESSYSNVMDEMYARRRLVFSVTVCTLVFVSKV